MVGFAQLISDWLRYFSSGEDVGAMLALLLLLLLECSLLMMLFARSFSRIELLDWMLLELLLSMLLSTLTTLLKALDRMLLIRLLLLLLLLLLDASSARGQVSCMERVYLPSSSPTMLVILR
jgi:hypothetical protein